MQDPKMENCIKGDALFFHTLGPKCNDVVDYQFNK